MSCIPASWSGGCRTSGGVLNGKKLATDPGDFGSVAMWRELGCYVVPTDASVAAATLCFAAAVWAAWIARAVDTALMSIVTATLLSKHRPAIFVPRLNGSSRQWQAIF